MLYTVTYRNPRGVRETLEIEAASREALFAELKRRGIAAISVAEGRARRGRGRSGTGILPVQNGRDARSTMPRSAMPRSAVRGILAGMIVVVIGIVAWLAVREPATVEEGPSAGVRGGRGVREAGAGKPQEAEEPPAGERAAEATRGAGGEAVAEEDPPPPLTPEEIEAEERRKDPLYDRHHIVAKMPLVKEPIEQLMLTVFTTELGDMPPMLPAIPAFDEERFEALVNRKTMPEDGDSEEALMSKELVNEVKEELAKYLKEGGTTSGFLSYYVNELDAAFRERETCKELVMKSMKTDDPEVARSLYTRYNERLASKGIKPLTLTRRQREYLGIED